MNKIIKAMVLSLAFSAWAIPTHAVEWENTNILAVENSYQVPAHGWQKNKLWAENKSNVEFSEQWSLESRVRFSYDKQKALLINPKRIGNYSKMSQPWYINDQTIVDWRELFLIRDQGAGNLKIGKQQVAWGETEGLRVLDVINPFDYTEFLLKDFDETRIPIWMVNYSHHFQDIVDLQFLFIPDTTVSLIPDGRFQPKSPRLVPNVAGQPTRLIQKNNRVSGSIDNADYAVRLSKSINSIDISAIYIYQYNDDYLMGSEYLADGGLSLTPQFARRNLFGLTYSQGLGLGVMRAEVSYSDKEQFYFKDSTKGRNGIAQSSVLNYVVAFDWPGLQDGTISGQLFQRIILDDMPYALTQNDVDTSWSLMLNQAYMNDKYQLNLLYLRSVNDNDAMATAKIKWAFNDNTDISLGYNRFMGQSTGLFGQYKDNSRVNVDFKYTF